VLSFIAALLLVQTADSRLRTIASKRQPEVNALLQQAGLTEHPSTLLLRAFKEEKVLEVWAGSNRAPLKLLTTYPICAASGELGPKRREGDLQVPEGLYRLTQLNPFSHFHLSLKVDYPNASDALRSDKQRPGGLIYLHGGCASIGCIAIEDAPIEIVYVLAERTRHRFIHIFPFKMTSERLSREADNVNISLWNELFEAHRAFETDHRLRALKINPRSGAYLTAP
jgi:murein L,D-transpeptidase YafK